MFEKDKGTLSNVEFGLGSQSLIIDVLGTEAQNAVSMQFIFELINKRILNGKKMIISTNLSVKDIIARYTARIGDCPCIG